MVNSLEYNESLNYGILELGSKVFNEKEPREIIDEKIDIYRQRFFIELPYVDDTHLSLNRISKEIINDLNKMPKLVSLDLSKASLSQLPKEISNLKLNSLDLTNHTMACLPDCLGSFPSLRILKISTLFPHFIPTTLLKLEKLNVLEVNIQGIKNLGVLADYLKMRKAQKSDAPKELTVTYRKKAKSVLYEWVYPHKEHKWNLATIAEPLKIVLTCLEKTDLDISCRVSKTLRTLINVSVPLRETSLANSLQNYLQTTLEKKNKIVHKYTLSLKDGTSFIKARLVEEILQKLHDDQWQLQKLLNEEPFAEEVDSVSLEDNEKWGQITAAIPASNPPNVSKKMCAITTGVFSLQDPMHPFLWFNEINQTLHQASGYTDWSDGYD